MKKLIAVCLIPITSYSASFDCNKAQTINEHLICGNSDLSKIDSDLGILYKKAKLSAKNKKGFQARTLHEFQRREKECNDTECLKEWFDYRKLELSSNQNYKLYEDGNNVSLTGRLSLFKGLNNQEKEQYYLALLLDTPVRLGDTVEFRPSVTKLEVIARQDLSKYISQDVVIQGKIILRWYGASAFMLSEKLLLSNIDIK